MAVGEGHRGLVATNVVGIGQDRAVADDYAGAAAPTAESDDRWADLVKNCRERGLELVECCHRVFALRLLRMCVRSNLQVAS